MAEEDYFDCREKAEGRRKKLSRAWPRTDIMVVEYAVDVRPFEGRLQFNYRSPEGTIDMESVHEQFEQFWRQETGIPVVALGRATLSRAKPAVWVP